MLITNIKEFKIQYDEPLDLLRVEWVAGHDMHRLRPALEQLYQLAHQLQITHCLLALDSMPDISAYDQIWIGAQWMPKVWKLPLQQTVIVLTAGQVYNQHAIETIINICRPFIKFDIQFFTQEKPAFHWLLDGSSRLPNLLAEWQADADTTTNDVAEPLATYKRT